MRVFPQLAIASLCLTLVPTAAASSDEDPLYLVWWAAAEADLVARQGLRAAQETAGLGADAPFSCTAFYLNDCFFPCLPGDRVVVRATFYTTWNGLIYGAASCGGAHAVCDDWVPCSATSAGTAAPPAGVGTCTSSRNTFAICYAIRGTPPTETVGEAAQTAIDIVNAVPGIVLGAVDGVSDHDRDTHRAPEEVTSNSDPLNAGSRPTSDEDGDGVQNKDERSRVHATSTLVANALARTTSADRVTLHFGHSGARATVRSPEGNVMTITYVATQASAGCPPAVAIAVPDAAACLAPPAVATFSLSGDLVSARRAEQPAVSIPAGAFVVSCGIRAAGRCLEGVGMDGTWTFVPATQAASLMNQAKLPAGFVAVIGGKTYSDVSPASGDIRGSGNGEENRDPLMPLRVWNWHHQAAGTTLHACSGGLGSSCLLDSSPQEAPLESRQYL